jgi:hypothetical protein
MAEKSILGDWNLSVAGRASSRIDLEKIMENQDKNHRLLVERRGVIWGNINKKRKRVLFDTRRECPLSALRADRWHQGSLRIEPTSCSFH